MKLYDLLLLMERETRGQISLEPVNPRFWTHPNLQLDARLNFHNLEYCRFIKRLDANAACARNKRRSMDMATHGHRFCGCCPFGMWELAQPVMHNGKLAAILYFGGFCQREKLAQQLQGPIFTGRIPPEITPEKIAQIKRLATFTADFIRCELTLLNNELETKPERHVTPDYYIQKVRLYVAKHYRHAIQLPDVANACHLTPNYLSDLLKKHTGQTFRQVLTAFRMDEAKVALKYNPNLSIAEVALNVGFTDSNYFCTVFKKSQGCSPRAYRQAWVNLRGTEAQKSNQAEKQA